MSFVNRNLRYLKARLESIPLPDFSRRAVPAAATGQTPSNGLFRRIDQRHPRVAKAARIALVALTVFLALPYVMVLVYRFIDPPFSALMVHQAVTGTPVRQNWMSIEEISPNLPRAVVTSEDSAFCDHWGVDWSAVQEAIDEADEGDIPRGASTIPMQVAKNLFLWQGQTYVRKALELPLAYWITFVWPKWRVLDVYLNIAEWGPGVFGADAAARHHFGKSAADLTEAEAALLAAALPNPIVRNAGRPGPKMRALASKIQGRVNREGGSAQCVAN